MTTITKATTKGQITIPAQWRNNFETNMFMITSKEGVLEIKPFFINDIKESEYTVFDAIKDNKGKGIKAKDLVKLLKETL
jgi:AbrB family looped-hinge helix DNA binding protein